MPMLPLGQNHITAGQPDTEEDIQHRATEAGGERHDGEPEAGDGDVGDEVAQAVADGEDGQAQDGVGHVDDDAEGAQDADDFVGDGADPCDGDYEAYEAEELAPARGAGGGCGGEDDGQHDEARGEAVQRLAEQGVRVLRLDVRPYDEDDEEGRREDLDDDEPAVPFLGRGGGVRVGGEGALGKLFWRAHDVLFGDDEELGWCGYIGVVRAVRSAVLLLQWVGVGAPFQSRAIEPELRIQPAADWRQRWWKTELGMSEVLIIIITCRLDDRESDCEQQHRERSHKA